MPSINLNFAQGGPLIRVAIGLSEPHRVALQKAGKDVPAFVIGTFLIDTGASGTCVDPSLVASLNLSPTGAVMIQTPSTNGVAQSCPQYDVAQVIPSEKPEDPPLIFNAVPVMETGLRSQGIDGLLGRDILQKCIFITNGPTASFTLAY
jgi:Aspartyl protease